MGAARWEHFEHGADIGVRGYGASPAEAFEQAALALTAVVADPAAVPQRRRIALHCEAPEDDLLLVDWLNALVYRMDADKLLFGRFRVRLAPGRLDGEAWGGPVTALAGGGTVEVKGATYTALRLAREPDGLWVAQCVVDV